MRIAHLALLFACIAFPMYMMGLQSPMMQIIGNQGGSPLDYSFVIDTISKNWIGIGVLAVGIMFLTGFSAVFIIPSLILAAIVNFILIPTSFLLPAQCIGNQLACNDPVTTMLSVFLNLVVILAMMEYIRGGG